MGKREEELAKAESKGYNRGFDDCWKMFDEYMAKVIEDRSVQWSREVLQMVSARKGQEEMRRKRNDR
jgi:hypothetical protein